MQQVAAANGEVIITNDGATILQKMTVTQPAAKMLVELSKSQVHYTAWLPQQLHGWSLLCRQQCKHAASCMQHLHHSTCLRDQ